MPEVLGKSRVPLFLNSGNMPESPNFMQGT